MAQDPPPQPPQDADSASRRHSHSNSKPTSTSSAHGRSPGLAAKVPSAPALRSGTLTYSRKSPGTLDLRAEGKIDGGAAFTETGSAEWNADKKTITWVERLSTGLELRSVGDWSSPIGIRAESEPVKAGPQTVRVRRLVFHPFAAVLHGHRRNLGERRAVSAPRQRPLSEGPALSAILGAVTVT